MSENEAFFNLALILFGLALLGAIIRSAIKSTVGTPKARQPSHDREENEPGNYRIVGIDRSTKLDTTWYCYAQSQANAKEKGILEGISVTKVERVP